MKKRRGLFLCLLAALVLFSASAYALAPLIIWAGQAVRFLAAPLTRTVIFVAKRIASADKKTVELTKAMEVSATLHAAVGLTAIYLAHRDAGEEGNQNKAAITVQLNDKSPQRDNPDPEKWSDAASGAVEPTLNDMEFSATPGHVDFASMSNAGGGSVTYSDNEYVFTPSINITGVSGGVIAVKNDCTLNGNNCSGCYSYTPASCPKTLIPNSSPGYYDCYTGDVIHHGIPARVESHTCTYYTSTVVSYSSVYPRITSASVQNGVVEVNNTNYKTLSSADKVSLDKENLTKTTWSVSGSLKSDVERSVVVPNVVCGQVNVLAKVYPDSSNPYAQSNTIKDAVMDVYCAPSESDIENAVSSYANSNDHPFSITDVQSSTRKFSYISRFESDNDVHYIHRFTVEPICASGQYFNKQLDKCVSSSSAEKPATLPCEIIYKGGVWQTDVRNPNCVEAGNAYDIQGNNLHLRDADTEIEIIRNADGTYKIRANDGDGWKTINTGGYSESNGGAPLSDVIDSGTGGFVRDVYVIHTGGSGNGDGEGGGSCGGSGQPPCSVDDSGFDGRADGLAGKFGELDEANGEGKKAMDDYKASDNFGFLSDWFPKLWPERVACQDLVVPLEFSKGPLRGLWRTKIEFCDKASGIRGFIGWLVYLMTVIYLWRRFTSANSSGDEK
jgi:hypothetical protein